MAKKSAKFLLVLIVLAISTILLPCNSFAAKAISVKDSNIVYNSIEKVIEIEENKTLSISERITLTYKSSNINVGFARHISKVNKVTRIVDGKEIAKTYVCTLTLNGVTVDGKDEASFVERDGDYYVINVGADNNYKAAGQYVYELNYTYALGEDFLSAFDDFTFDLMDYDYLTSVENFSATIIFPNDVSEYLDDLTFRTNNFEPLSDDDVNLTIESDDNSRTKLSVSIQNIPAESGVTMQLILPNGYFATTYTPHALYYVTIAICVLSILGIVLLIFSHKFHKKPVVTAEFYPPKYCSAIDVAKIYRGKVKNRDFSALIIEWASKKLVKIEMIDKKTVRLIKLKDFPKLDENIPIELLPSKLNEMELFDAFFASGTVFVARSNKTIKNLPLQRAVNKIYSRDEKEKKKSLILRVLISAISVLPIIFHITWYMVYVGGVFFFYLALIFPVVALIVFVYVPLPWWFKLFWCGLFGGAPLGMMLYVMFLPYDFLYLSIVCALILIAGFCLTPLVKVFSEFERSMQGKVLGFKNFLKVAEIDRLKMLVEENPEYFYQILPYCYIFNLTDKMEEKFEALNIEKPDYLGGGSTLIIGSIISRTIVRKISSFTATSHSSSRIGGGGRRGSSGGGAGGGGARGR